jgi:hypothetical protein
MTIWLLVYLPLSTKLTQNDSIQSMCMLELRKARHMPRTSAHAYRSNNEDLV